MKLLKQKDYIRYNQESFEQDYGIKPIRIIDLKGLAGDTSDNIPGVHGIGEKTALNLLQQYESLEGIYENIDSIHGKTKERLLEDKAKALMSKEIATIYKDVPLEIKDLEDLHYTGQNDSELEELYEELEFYSFLKNLHSQEKTIPFTFTEDLSLIEDESEYAIYLELDGSNYHTAQILGLGLATKQKTFFISKEKILDVISKIKDKVLYTYDYKKALVALSKRNIPFFSCNTDLMIAYALLQDSSKDDIAFYMVPNGFNVEFLEAVWKKKEGLTDKLKKETDSK